MSDPGHLPEVLADFAVRRVGPAVSESVAALRRNHPTATEAELRARVITRGRRAVVSEGALVGGPFLVLIPVAFCAALLRQARTVLELAALDGRDPTAGPRAAELLVLQGVYEDTRQAQHALTRTGSVTGAPARWKRWVTLWNVTLRMARLLGILTPDDGSRDADRSVGRVGRIAVQAWRWSLLCVVLLVGMVAPLVWLPYMAATYHRADTRLAERALAYYFADTPQRPRRRTPRLEPDVIAATLRAVLSLLVPVALIAMTFLTGLRIADSRWPVLGITLAAASATVGALWYRGRHRHS
ncbi:hypothetical protein [Streptomyces sp. NPDC057382]|uniref:hypothetical protein n=1 Tax=unclassified Streptomyces TaxID=2593676 RepID=UPI003642451F